MSVIYFINLFFSGRLIVYKIITLTFFISFFLLYLQGNFLSGKLPTLTGEKIIWENYGKTENIILLSALIVLVIAAIILVRRVKLDRTLSYASVGVGIVSLILAIALVSTIIRNDTFMKKENPFAATTKNFNNISSNRNFLIFVVDTVDSRAFYDVMSQDEDFKEMFEDFTYYSDALSVSGRTWAALLNVLTGSVMLCDIDRNYSSKAHNQSPFYKKLKQNGYDINIYSRVIAWDGKRNFNIENSRSIRDIKVNVGNFKKQVWRYVRFKYLPYGYKQYSHIEAMDFDSCKVRADNLENYNMSNKSLYNRIKQNQTLIKKDRKFFSLIHAEGAHPPFNMDRYFNAAPNGKLEQKIAASLTLIKAYLQRLKSNNSYDNSVIVVMSDHGYSSDHIIKRGHAMLLIKGVGEKHKMLISDLPISYVDLQDAFSNLIDGKKSTELFTSITYGRTRKFSLLDFGAKEFVYRTTGPAWDTEQYTPAGKTWE